MTDDRHPPYGGYGLGLATAGAVAVVTVLATKSTPDAVMFVSLMMFSAGVLLFSFSLWTMIGSKPVDDLSDLAKIHGRECGDCGRRAPVYGPIDANGRKSAGGSYCCRTCVIDWRGGP